jgi:hypothetical protein
MVGTGIAEIAILSGAMQRDTRVPVSLQLHFAEGTGDRLRVNDLLATGASGHK